MLTAVATALGSTGLSGGPQPVLPGFLDALASPLAHYGVWGDSPHHDGRDPSFSADRDRHATAAPAAEASTAIANAIHRHGNALAGAAAPRTSRPVPVRKRKPGNDPRRQVDTYVIGLSGVAVVLLQVWRSG